MENEHDSHRRTFLKSASLLAGAVAVGTSAREAVGTAADGGEAHRNWITYLETKLTSFGLTPKRYPVHLNYWEPTDWSLNVKDSAGTVHDIPGAFYWPYAGETPAEYYPSTANAAEFVKPVISLVPRDLALDKVSFIRPFFNGKGGIGLLGARSQGAIDAFDQLSMPLLASQVEFCTRVVSSMIASANF